MNQMREMAPFTISARFLSDRRAIVGGSLPGGGVTITDQMEVFKQGSFSDGIQQVHRREAMLSIGPGSRPWGRIAKQENLQIGRRAEAEKGRGGPCVRVPDQRLSRPADSVDMTIEVEMVMNLDKHE